MPRAALLSIHARVEGTEPSTWEDPSLVQLWGPRFSVFVVAARDLAVFSLGLLPDHEKRRRRSEDMAERLRVHLGGRRMAYGQAGHGLGLHDAYMLRYAAATGTVLLRWDGARQPFIWIVPSPEASPTEARLELARRYLHIYGPTTVESFSWWSGIGPRGASAAFGELRESLTPAQTPIGDAWILTQDEEVVRADPQPAPPARLLPSGDAYLLLNGVDRDLLVADADRRDQLWTPRVWPGGLLIDGEIAGTWRRANAVMTLHPWRRLTGPEREVVTAEAESMPIPGIKGPVIVRWGDLRGCRAARSVSSSGRHLR
jgi:hypothetical protein